MGVPIMWLAWIQCAERARVSGWVFLPLGWHGNSVERVRVSRACLPFGWHGFSAERGARERVFLPFGWHGYSAERVFLPFGWHGFSAERARVSGCA